jgi:type IV secretion system protein TrbL
VSSRKASGRFSIALGVAVLVLCCAPSATAQISSNNPSQILQQYRNFRITWITNIWPYANTLFALLATIEFAWSAAVMALEKGDLQSWTSALIRKIMWLGAFYALLLFGRQWIPAIIDSSVSWVALPLASTATRDSRHQMYSLRD